MSYIVLTRLQVLHVILFVCQSMNIMNEQREKQAYGRDVLRSPQACMHSDCYNMKENGQKIEHIIF